MFKNGYMKEGKGVERRDPDKPKIMVFFELLFRKLWRLCKLNLLYLVTCIPTFAVLLILAGLVSNRITHISIPMIAETLGIAVSDTANINFSELVAMLDMVIRVAVAFIVTVFWGMGPATAGYTYILRNYAREEHAWLLSDFFGKAKQNFGQALVVWIVDMIFLAVTAVAFMFYVSQQGAIRYLAYVIVSVVIVYTVMHFYIYLCMITFKLKIKELLKNSLIFALLEAPKNLLILLVLTVVHIVIPYLAARLAWSISFWIVFIILELFILVAASGFMVNFWVYPTIEKYIIEAEKK